MLIKILSINALFLINLLALDGDMIMIEYADPYQNEQSKKNIQVNTNTNTDDQDNDNVPDDIDMCPTTPNGVCTDANGCTQKVKRVVNFDSSSYKLTKEFQDKLNVILEIAQECFGYKLLAIGHTDSTASEKFNKHLSKQRANAIRNFFISNGINSSRIKTKWYGETQPIASNITKDGRFENRRVEIIFY